MKEFITSFPRAEQREGEKRHRATCVELYEDRGEVGEGDACSEALTVLNGLGPGPESHVVDVLPSQQLDMKEQVRSYFRMLLIPNVSLRSHSFHMEFIKECKKHFQGKYAISLEDKFITLFT